MSTKRRAKTRLKRYTCSHEDGSEPRRVLATDHLHAAEQYFRCDIEDAPEAEQNCIGSVLVVSPDGTAQHVTVQSQMVLDVEAVRTTPV